MSHVDIDPSEVVELLRDLIRIDTSNPPGGETAAAEFLASYLREAGAEVELAGPDPERLNLIARVRGGGSGPSLMLMAHTDVVPAPADNWTVDPFAGVLRDGMVVGRGAADMKGELAARAVAVATLARSGTAPAGDVVLIAESDEEKNRSDVGMSWLVRERPDIRCDFAINEGGGSLFELADGRRVVLTSVGEKKVSAIRIRIHGTAGHASTPDDADNPIAYAARAIEALLAARSPMRMTPVVERALESLGAPGSGEEGLAWASRLHPMLKSMLPPMTTLTVTPTGLQTHEPSNVIPPVAEIVCDCRALPDQDEGDVHAHVEEALGGDYRWDMEFLEPLAGGTESPIGTPLYEVMESFVAERLDGATLLPFVTPGFTDSHWVRSAFGTVAYGFAPVFHMDQNLYAEGMHGADESLAVDDLAEILRFNLAAIERLYK